jgi:uncharacterized membrane protein YfcA
MEIWTSPQLGQYEIWVAGVVILISGTLLNGAGLGGGGVFVAILISIMSMTAHEAVPVTKLVIFLSAIVTFYLNTVRKHREQLIDFALVRSFVPMSLAGTSVGVLINTTASERLLMIMLCVLLGSLVCVSAIIAYRKVQESKSPTAEQDRLPPARMGQTHVEMAEVTQHEEADKPSSQHAAETPAKPSNNFRRHLNLLALLIVVIACGIVSNTQSIAKGIRWTMFGLSIAACISIWIHVYIHEEPRKSIIYPLVGLVGGVCSGLFGVGGGLIYAPFLLHMQVDPETAVAISSTCVLFASASTSLQYLFTGRLAVLIALFLSLFGIISAVAGSYCARALVRYTNKPYIVHVMVAGAVLVSAGVTIADTIIRA